jgi:hypothetical protein
MADLQNSVHQNNDSHQSEQEQALFQLVEIVNQVCQANGIDFQALSPDEQIETVNLFYQNFAGYLSDVAKRINDPNLLKQIGMLVKSGGDSRIIAKYPTLQNFFEITLKSYIQELI